MGTVPLQLVLRFSSFLSWLHLYFSTARTDSPLYPPCPRPGTGQAFPASPCGISSRHTPALGLRAGLRFSSFLVLCCHLYPLRFSVHILVSMMVLWPLPLSSSVLIVSIDVGGVSLLSLGSWFLLRMSHSAGMVSVVATRQRVTLPSQTFRIQLFLGNLQSRSRNRCSST